MASELKLLTNKGYAEMAQACSRDSGSKGATNHHAVLSKCLQRGENELIIKQHAEKAAADKLAADKLAAEKLAAEKLAAEKLAAEKARLAADAAKAAEAAKKATSSDENNRKLGELYEVYNNYLKSTQYKDTTDSITKSEFSKKLISSITEQYFVNNTSHWKSKFETWMKERNTACERTIKDHLGGCMKDLGFKDSDIFAKYVQYTSQGHRSPLLFNLTPNTNWPSKPEAFFDNISNNIIKDKIWEVLSASRFTPNSTGKSSFLKNITKDNKSRCIRYEYYKNFIEARDKKCIEVIVSGLKSSAGKLKCKFPTYGLPTDTNKMVDLYLQYCGGNKVPFQETFNEINNYTTIIKVVKERDSNFFDSIFEKIANANPSSTITPAASSCPPPLNTKQPTPVKSVTPPKNGWMGYMSENPMTTAAVGLGALGVGAWAYNKYRRSSSKSRSSSKNKSAKSSDEKSNDDEKNSDNEKSNDDEKSNVVKSNVVKSNESVVTANRKRNSGTKKKK